MRENNPIIVDEDSSFSQVPTSSTLVFDSVKNKYSFFPLNGSNTFCTVDYDARTIRKTDYPMNHVNKSLSIQEPNTLHHISELERAKLLTLLAKTVQNPPLDGCLSK